MTMLRTPQTILVSAAVAALLATPAAAAVHRVGPGPGTPLQDAIAAASPGDTLHVSPGDYFGPVVVDKKLRIRARPNTATNIRTGCGAPTALVVAADDVEVRNFQIFAGSSHGVLVDGRSRVKLTNLRIFDDCDAAGPGLRIASSSKVRATGIHASGFGDAQIHVVDVASGADVKLIRASSSSSGAANVVVENVAPKALMLLRCQAVGSSTALELRNADGVRVSGGYSGQAAQGVVVGVGSDDNVFTAHRFGGNGVDVVDSGASNCWRGSRNVTGVPVTGNPSTAGCP